MKLPFCPMPLSGELLYSWLARCGRFLGGIGPKALMAAFYGNRSIIATADLPNHIDDFASRLRSPLYDAPRIIRDHTLFRYYTAFQSEAVRRKAMDAMLGGGGSVHFTLGLSTFRTIRPAFLQFCRECQQASLREHGFMYWHAEHQLPGVLVCNRHTERLRRSNVSLLAGNRHEYVAATEETCPDDAALITAALPEDLRELAWEFSFNSAALLRGDELALEPGDLGVAYRERLAELGFMKGKHKVRQAWLAQAMEDEFGGLQRRMTGVGLEASYETWLASITRPRCNAHSPAQHVLLRMFLNRWEDMPQDRRIDRLDDLAGRGPPDQSGIEGSIDWEARDKDYSARLRRQAFVLKRRSPPVRITLSALEGELEGRGWLSKRRSRMPVSEAVAQEIVEDADDFRQRRMYWHLQRCTEEEINDPWVVMRRAGLPKEFIGEVRRHKDRMVRIPRAEVLRRN